MNNQLTSCGAAPGLRQRAAIAAVFAAFVFAFLGVVWSFRFLPTYDGPAHLASAVIWVGLEHPETRYHEFYAFAPKQVPNLTSQFLLAALVRLVAPLTAEKILVTIYICGFARAFWYFLTTFGQQVSWLAPLGLLFLFNRAFFSGFYNYCLSLIAFWYIAGYCARRSQEFGNRQAVWLALILVAAYFTHLVGWALAIAAAGCFLTFSPGDRLRNLRRLVFAALPSLLLAGDYAVTTGMIPLHDVADAANLLGKGGIPSRLTHNLWSFADEVFGPIGRAGALFSPAVVSAVAAYEVLIVVAILSRDRNGVARHRRLPVVVLGALLFGAYCVLPDHLGRHGGYVLRRLAFLPPMLILATLRLPASPVARRMVLLAVYSSLFVNIRSAAVFFRSANADIEEYTAAVNVIPTDAVLFTEAPLSGASWPSYLEHAACYYCLTTRNIALENYQAAAGPFFWIQLPRGIERGYGDFRAYRSPSLIDFVLTWDDREAHRRLPPNCREVFSGGRLRVFATPRDGKKTSRFSGYALWPIRSRS